MTFENVILKKSKRRVVQMNAYYSRKSVPWALHFTCKIALAGHDMFYVFNADCKWFSPLDKGCKREWNEYISPRSSGALEGRKPLDVYLKMALGHFVTLKMDLRSCPDIWIEEWNCTHTFYAHCGCAKCLLSSKECTQNTFTTCV